MKNLLILNYHAILPIEKGEPIDSFSIRYSHFLEQLDWVEKSKTPIIPLNWWLKQRDFNEKLVVALTFDDGSESHYQLVFPELKKRNISATFFPIVSKIGQEGYLNWSQIEEMCENGFEIGSHGFNHKRLVHLSEKHLQEEIVSSKLILHEKLKQNIQFFSLPFGVSNHQSMLQLKAEYKTILTTRSILNKCSAPISILHRFNMKSQMTQREFEKILHGNTWMLIKKRICSTFSFYYNQFQAFVHRFHN